MKDGYYSDEEMLNALKDFYNKHGRRPYMKDFKGVKPSCDMIAKRFGSWRKALDKAGVEFGKVRESDYSKEQLLEFLHDYYNKYNKIPTIRGIKSKGYPTAHAYINHFGSFKNALIESGLYNLRNDKHQFCKEYTNDEMLDILRTYIKSKNYRIPTYEEMKKDKIKPSVSTYDRRFNGVYNAFKLIGYDIENKERKI